MCRLIFVMAMMSSLSAAAGDWRELFEKREFSREDAALKYRMARLAPEDKDGPLPLVLFLHGMGERGDDNGRQLTHGMEPLVKWSAKNKQWCLVVAPQCPGDTTWTALEGDYKTPGRVKLSDEPGAAMKSVLALVKSLVEDGKADPERLYITGLSMGGYGTFGAIAHEPDLFAAAMPICGGADLSTAGKLAKLPIWIFHGDDDRIVPAGLSTAMAEALEKAGGTPKLSIYEGVGHDSWTKAYNSPETWEWLFAQKR